MGPDVIMAELNASTGTNCWDRVLRHSRKSALVANYCAGRFRYPIVWVIGDGRSGTTWLMELINWRKTYREMFEPFHPRFVNGRQAPQ
jgi:hypothetical protein